MRETIARLEWGERKVFRLSRLEDTHEEAARLTLPGGEVVELRKDDWLQVAVAVNRLFASQPVGLSKREPLNNTGKPWTKALDVDLASRWLRERSLGKRDQLSESWRRTLDGQRVRSHRAW